MNQPAHMINTPRLCLRALTNVDVRPLQEHVFSDAAVMEHALLGQPMSLSQSEQFIRENFASGGLGKKLGVLVERMTEQVIGFSGLMECNTLGEPDCELGFVLRRSAWGRGYATEIGRGQLEYGFNTLRLRRLLALVSPMNKNSITVLKKIGMEFNCSVESTERGERQVYIAWNPCPL